ncbi:hypothetical protein C8J57DRAFT_1215949 [Mycena rebaudengoi]|nr:hypothetical protein C8J57DRAFT_1215949 [Mycena rebaudengoi]
MGRVADEEVVSCEGAMLNGNGLKDEGGNGALAHTLGTKSQLVISGGGAFLCTQGRRAEGPAWSTRWQMKHEAVSWWVPLAAGSNLRQVQRYSHMYTSVDALLVGDIQDFATADRLGTLSKANEVGGQQELHKAHAIEVGVDVAQQPLQPWHVGGPGECCSSAVTWSYMPRICWSVVPCSIFMYEESVGDSLGRTGPEWIFLELLKCGIQFLDLGRDVNVEDSTCKSQTSPIVIGWCVISEVLPTTHMLLTLLPIRPDTHHPKKEILTITSNNYVSYNIAVHCLLMCSLPPLGMTSAIPKRKFSQNNKKIAN